MDLYLQGHDYKYAAEQVLLTQFPQERPVYPDHPPRGDRAELRLFPGKRWYTATCLLVWEGKRHRGMARVPAKEITGDLLRDRLDVKQDAVKEL